MSTSDRPSLHELAAAYALGALDREEARAFEEVLASSAEARRELAEYREVTALLALAGPGDVPQPDRGLRGRVLARIEREKVVALPASARTRAPARGVRFALAASLLAAVGLGALAWSLDRRRDAVERDVARLRADSAGAVRELARRDAQLESVLGPGVELHLLTATGDTAPGIQLFLDRRRNRATVHAFNLPPAPPGRAYQLWFIRDGTPVPSVTFNPEPGGRALVHSVEVPAGGELSAAAVTEEPETGSAAPTTPILLVGSLSS